MNFLYFGGVLIIKERRRDEAAQAFRERVVCGELRRV